MRRHGGGRSPHGGRGQSPRGGARSSGRAGGQIGREAPILGDVFAPLWGAFDDRLLIAYLRQERLKLARYGQPTRPPPKGVDGPSGAWVAHSSTLTPYRGQVCDLPPSGCRLSPFLIFPYSGAAVDNPAGCPPSATAKTGGGVAFAPAARTHTPIHR